MIQLPELQDIDFAFGAFLSGAFKGHDPNGGPKAWREFLKRPVNQQIYRHDTDSPSQFVKDFLESMKGGRKTGETTHVNAPLLPVVYYCRKPGLVNTQDQKGSRGRVWKDGKAFTLKQRPVALDYNLVLLAWDKLTLDKLVLAWYAYIYDNDAFYYPCVVGSESFDVRVSLMDNKNVALQNGSETTGDDKRLYAATTPVSIMSNVIFGNEIPPPGPVRVIFGGARENELHYTLDLDGAAYRFTSGERGRVTAIRPGTVNVMVGARIVATDDGHGRVLGHFEQDDKAVVVNGLADYFDGNIAVEFSEVVTGVVSAAFTPLQGRTEAAYI